MTVVILVLNDLFDSMRAEAKISEEQFITSLIQSTTGGPVGEEIWIPSAQ